MRYFLIISLLLLFHPSVCAQSIHKGIQLNDYIFRHIDNADGLMSNYFHGITQDHNGFIWIGTPNNLFQYDGHMFINFSDKSIDKGSEINFDLRVRLDGKDNGLIINNRGSIRQLNLYDNTFADVAVVEKNHSLEDTYIDSKGDKYYIQREANPSSTSERQNDYFHVFNDKRSKPDLFAYGVEDKKNNRVWLNYHNGGMKLFDGKTHRIYDHNFNPIDNPCLRYFKNKGQIRDIKMDWQGNLWILIWQNAVYKYNLATQKVTEYAMPKIFQRTNNKSIIGGINCTFIDDHGVLWLGGSNTGLLQYDHKQDKFNYVVAEPSNAHGIQYKRDIHCLYQDKNSNIWIGTDRGINIFNPYKQNFNFIQHDESNNQSLKSADINAMIETNHGTILVGTWGGGITAFDLRLQFKQHVGAISDNEKLVWSFIEKDEETIWAGCQHGLLLEIDQKTLKTTKFYPAVCEKYTIRCMAKDTFGNIYLGLHNGKVVQWLKKENRFVPFLGLAKPLDYINILFIDAQNEIWVSTKEGIKKFDPKMADFSEHYKHNRNDPLSISSLECNGIEQLNDSILLFGTKLGGINLFNKRTKTFSQLYLDNNKQPYTVLSIKKDNDGNVWFTTEYAIYKYIPSSGQFINISKKSKVLDNSFSSSQFVTTKEQDWFTWTYTEAIRFSPDKINLAQKSKSNVILSAVKVGDTIFHEYSILRSNKPMVLSHKQNFIQFYFTTLNFSDIEMDAIFYKLSGVDETWKMADKSGTANYTDLQPGRYELQLKSDVGDYQSGITSFVFVIEPPFYLTWWFKILVFSILVGMVVQFVRHRVKKNEAQQKSDLEIAKKISSLEMQALKSQMNPHFIFNCINSIDSLIQGNDKYNATVYLNKFAKLIRNILDSSKQNVVSLSKDVETLKLYIQLEELRADNKFAVEFMIEEELLSEDYSVPPLIVQPFVENAILHGLRYRPDNMGKLKINIKKHGDFIHYNIEDNGGGRNQNGSHVKKDKISYGIEMSTDRIRLFNEEDKASIQILDIIENEIVVGTKVEVQLKMQ